MTTDPNAGDRWTDRLSEYLDGGLGRSERAALESHLATCPTCAAVLGDLRAVVERSRALPTPPPPADLWPGVRSQIEAFEAARRAPADIRRHRDWGSWRVSLSFPLVTGLFGIGLGALYLASPTWRLAVTVDDTALSVVTGDRVKFRLPWAEVVKVVASPSTRTLFVDGGDPRRSLLVPGDGAPAPYWIEERAALYDLIVAHVDATKIREVETLEVAQRAR